MTIEEIEIIVTAKVEEALKEFMKIAPAIRKQLKDAQEAFSKVDTKAMTNKVHQAVQFIKKKMQDLKKSNTNNEIAIKVNNKEANKQISQIQKEIDSLQKKINERQMKLGIITPKLDKIANEPMNKVMPERLENNSQYINLSDKEEMLVKEIQYYNKLIDEAKSKMVQLSQATNQTATTQNKMSSFFNTFKQKVAQVVPNIANIKNHFKGLPKITQNITNNIKGMSNNIKGGLKHILKYAGALLSIRGVYGLLRGTAQSWLSSQNIGAQQLSANIEYLKYSMGSVFANILQYITNLIYNLMKAVQSLVYAFSGVNIFAKATAKSMKSTSGSAKEAGKSLAGVHNEINNVSDNNSSGSGGSATPNIDLSQMDNEMNAFSQKLYDFFKPLVDSWNTYGNGLIEQVKTTASQIGSLISSVWGSFENIITNGTVYSILENILAIIGNIAEAFSNAWNYNGNGDVIIQTIANILNIVLNTIREISASEGFQTFLNGVSTAFEGILQFIEPVLEDFLAIAKPIAEIAFSTIGTVLETIGNTLKAIGENEIAVTILESIALAIGLVTIATKLFSIEKLKETGILIANAAAWVAANLPIILITAAIAAVIAIIILCVKHWDEIKETVTNVCKKIGDAVSQFGENIKKWFSETIENIKTNWNNFWSNLFSKGEEMLNNIKTGISNALNAINTAWNNVWTGIGNVVSVVWNGIWTGIKWVINLILGGIEGFVNGTIKGINKLLKGISNVASAVGSLIGLKPINLQISTISLPRLAKGGVLTEATAVIAGEYSGAKSNPEIVTPQNILRETFEDVMSNYAGNSGQPMHVTIQYLGKTIFDDTIDYINSKTRRTGKNTIVTVGD